MHELELVERAAADGMARLLQSTVSPEIGLQSAAWMVGKGVVHPRNSQLDITPVIVR